MQAQVDARMLRYADVSAEHICFVYAGDIWVVDKTGGIAKRLSSPKGQELFPRFSLIWVHKTLFLKQGGDCICWI